MTQCPHPSGDRSEDSEEFAHLENIKRHANGADKCYLDTGGVSALDETIESWRAILHHSAFAATPVSFQLAVLNDAGPAFLRRYRAQDRLDDLNQALTLWQRAVQLTPPDSPDLPAILSDLGGGLHNRYRRTGRIEDLDQAVQAFQRTVPLTPPDSPNLPGRLSNLGAGLGDRYGRTGQVEDLDQAVEAFQRAAGLTPPDSPDLPAILSNLGVALLMGYGRTGQVEDLDQAVEAFQRAAGLTPPDSPDLPAILSDLGGGLHNRYRRTGWIEDLDQAVQAFQRTVPLTPPDSPNLPGRLSNLGAGLGDRYGRTGQVEDLDQATQTFQRAVQLTPPDSPDLPMYFSNLGIGLRDRYGRTGHLEDLDQAIEALQRAVQLALSDSPNLSDILSDLGNGLRDRYRRTGRIEDLDQAIEAFQRAVQLALSDSPNLSDILSDLGNGLRGRYERTGRIEDLDQAVEVYQRAVQLTPPDSPNLHAILSSLGNGLLNRYRRAGGLEDLDQAIQARQWAVQLTSPDSSDLPGHLSNLGNALGDRYERTGKLEDLEGAIEALQRALGLIPPDSPDLPIILNNLGGGLLNRHGRTGSMEDLDQAVEVHQRAVHVVPPDSSDLPAILSDLGSSLFNRYGRTRRVEDLKRAIEAYQRAVHVVPPDSPDLPMYLSNLGNGLRDRSGRTGQVEDLEQAIQVYQRAVQLTPLDSPNLPAILSDLGGGLHNRYRRTGQVKDLEQAIEAFQRAMQLTHPDSPNLPIILSNLGVGLRDRYGRTGDMEALVQAIQAYQAACRLGLETTSMMALQSSQVWGNWATERKHWPEAADAYRYGTQALEQLYRAQLLRASKETWLAKAPGLHALAAYALAKTGDLGGAAIALERGRARLLSEALERDHADLERIQDKDPETYALYQSAAVRLRYLEIGDRRTGTLMGEGQTHLTPSDLQQQIRQARSDLDAAIKRIRRIPSYEDFMAQSDFDDIAKAVQTDIPVVYLTTTPAGSLTLILHRAGDATDVVVDSISTDAFNHLHLRELLEGPADDPILGGYLGAYDRWRRQPRDSTSREAWFAALDETTHRLWDTLMGPLVAYMATLGAQHTILIPTGLLGFLPLHAAWTKDPSTPTGRRYALDALTITYAPNARALVAARKMATKVMPDAILAIDNPDGSLHFSQQEVDAALSYFPETQRRVLRGGAATHMEVSNHLPQYPVWHLSTHGLAGWQEPLESMLLMAGEPNLTLRDLLNVRLQGARLAVLSACETGIPGAQLPNEVVSLPTGLVQAGVAGVVASLWSVSDLSTAMLMEHFYRLWREDGLVPALALREAQRWLRDTTNREKAEYFRRDVPALGGVRMPEPIALGFFEDRMLQQDLEALDLAHPFWWAAFYLTGV